MMKYELIRRTLSDVSEKKIPVGVQDPEELAPLPGETLNCFLQNPYQGKKDFVWQYVSAVDGVVSGHLGVFPIRLRCDKTLHDAISGSDLFVSEKYRKYGIGLSMLEDFFDDASEHVFVAYGISSMAEPLYKFCGARINKISVFTLPTRSSVKLALTARFGLTLLAPFADALLWGWRCLLKRKLACLKKFKEVINDKIPQQVDEIISSDPHPYAEWHGAEYLQWMKDNPMYPSVEKRKFHALYHGEDMVGFFMTAEHIRQIKIHGKPYRYKTGLVLEWGTKNDDILPEKLLILQALLSFGGRVHAVKVHTASPTLAQFMVSECKMRESDKYNWGIKIGKRSALANLPGITDLDNWRIRTAMGDVGLL